MNITSQELSVCDIFLGEKLKKIVELKPHAQYTESVSGRLEHWIFPEDCEAAKGLLELRFLDDVVYQVAGSRLSYKDHNFGSCCSEKDIRGVLALLSLQSEEMGFWKLQGSTFRLCVFLKGQPVRYSLTDETLSEVWTEVDCRAYESGELDWF